MNAQATICGVEPFVIPEVIAPSVAHVISFGLTAAEFHWCLSPRGLLTVRPTLPVLICDADPFLEFECADRNQKPALSVKAIALLASELGVEVSVTKKTRTFWGQYNEQIPSSTSRPWSPVREEAAIRRLLKAAGVSELWDKKSFGCDTEEIIVEGVCDEEGRELNYIESDDDSEFDGAEQAVFIEGTNSIDFRGSRKPDTAETRAAFAAEHDRLDGIIKNANFWSPLDPPEYTQTIKGRKINTKNKVFVELAFALSRLDKNHDGQKELAAQLGINYETARKQELKDMNKDKSFPTTPLPLGDFPMAEISRGMVFVHVTLSGRGWWYWLDMHKHKTYSAAIEEVRWKAQDEALDKAGVPKRRTDTRTNADNPDLVLAFKEVVVRFAEAFNPKNLFILDLRSPMVVAIAEDEWGKVHQFGATGEGAQ